MKYAVLQQVREFIKDQENSECAKEQENSECAKEQENSECAEEQENREHAQFFSSWGPQIERDTPRKFTSLLLYHLFNAEIPGYSSTTT